jgi:hypothetical protein
MLLENIPYHLSVIASLIADIVVGLMACRTAGWNSQILFFRFRSSSRQLSLPWFQHPRELIPIK